MTIQVPYLKKFKLLKLYDIICLKTGQLVHGALYTFPVDYDFQHNTHNILTRRENYFTLPLCRTFHTQKSVIVRGVKLWNQLSFHIKNTVWRKDF